MKTHFDTQEIGQIEGHGLTCEQVYAQIENFRSGFRYLPISRAAVVGDGIIRLTDEQASQFEHLYNEKSAELDIEKFVPASGAATRMFRDLFEFVNSGNMSDSTQRVIENIEKFAFYPQLKEAVGSSTDSHDIISGVISTPGLSYGSQPKALILFHSYPEGGRTALEEHLVEGALYAAGKGVVRIHFTVSPEHLDGFKDMVNRVVPDYQERYGIKYSISYSSQKSNTDTIAVTPDNEPFRESDGRLLFRPAGHGALLSNLDDIDADIIYIKTIDNVTTDRLRADTVRYKKVLAGMLVSLQDEIKKFVAALEGLPNKATLDDVADFVVRRLSYKPGEDFIHLSDDKKTEYLLDRLDRPVRVCGMVRNEGEPGGGPFWVTDQSGGESLQIAESSQIAPDRAELMFNATHFNPVDLVCGVRDYNGRKFSLKMFTDPSTGFISNKSKDGRELKAQELPGLWNGSMAGWNTLFVEVPVSTFTPVKEVSDLLRQQHR